jgi:hypothetical protein
MSSATTNLGQFPQNTKNLGASCGTPAKRRGNAAFRRELAVARCPILNKGAQSQGAAGSILVQAWMLFTGQSEEDARKAVSGLYSATLQRQVLRGMSQTPEGEGPST